VTFGNFREVNRQEKDSTGHLYYSKSHRPIFVNRISRILFGYESVWSVTIGLVFSVPTYSRGPYSALHLCLKAVFSFSKPRYKCSANDSDEWDPKPYHKREVVEMRAKYSLFVIPSCARHSYPK